MTIIAGKTKPNIIVEIYDGNLKLSSVTSDSHGDWVGEEKIDSGLKRFNLKHSILKVKLLIQTKI